MAIDQTFYLIPKTSNGHVAEPDAGSMVPYGKVSLHKLEDGRIVVRCIKAVDVIVPGDFFDQEIARSDAQKTAALDAKSEIDKL